jgi:hypothetical protein
MFYEKTQYKGDKSTDVAWDLGLLYGPTPKDCRLPIACPQWHNTGAIKQLDGSTTLRDIKRRVVTSVLNSVCTLRPFARPEPAGLSTLTRTVMMRESIACMLATHATLASLLQKKDVRSA